MRCLGLDFEGPGPELRSYDGGGESQMGLTSALENLGWKIYAPRRQSQYFSGDAPCWGSESHGEELLKPRRLGTEWQPCPATQPWR